MSAAEPHQLKRSEATLTEREARNIIHATITKRLRRMNNVPCLTLSKSRLRTLQLMRLCGTHSQVTLSMMTSLLHRRGASISSLWYSIVHLLLFCTASLRAATVVIHRLGTIDGAVVIGGVIV